MAELFKFRCFQCQKLLGAPPSRIGSATTCPKCGTGLIVPPPLDAAQEDEPDGDEPDEPEIRLEDLGLRIEPEPISRPAPVTPAPPAAGPNPVAFLENLESEPEDDYPTLEGPDDTLSTPLGPASARRARRGSTATGRSRDVVFPRTAAIAWAMFALMALAAAFAAGLLIGHFLWR